jgi:hypothetical protein
VVSSVTLCALGLWVTFGVSTAARPGRDTYAEVAYSMGLGMILWVTGLLGVGRAAAHYRWARGVGVRGPAGPAAGISPGRPPRARRSAPRGRPPLGSGRRSRSSDPAA